MSKDIRLPDLGAIPDPFASDAASRPAPPAPSFREPARSPTRAGVQAAQRIALTAALAYQVVCLAWFKPHAGTRVGWTLWLGFVFPAATGLIALGAAIRRGSRGLGPPVDRVIWFAMMALGVFAAGTWLFAPHGFTDEPFWSEGPRCMGLTMLFAAGPAAVAALTFRHAFAAAARERAAAVGIACGALGAATMGIVCADGNAVHVLFVHGSPMIVMALAAAASARRLATV
jgi:hypothetical protein